MDKKQQRQCLCGHVKRVRRQRLAEAARSRARTEDAAGAPGSPRAAAPRQQGAGDGAGRYKSLLARKMKIVTIWLVLLEEQRQEGRLGAGGRGSPQDGGQASAPQASVPEGSSPSAGEP